MEKYSSNNSQTYYVINDQPNLVYPSYVANNSELSAYNNYYNFQVPANSTDYKFNYGVSSPIAVPQIYPMHSASYHNRSYLPIPVPISAAASATSPVTSIAAAAISSDALSPVASPSNNNDATMSANCLNIKKSNSSPVYSTINSSHLNTPPNYNNKVNYFYPTPPIENELADETKTELLIDSSNIVSPNIVQDDSDESVQLSPSMSNDSNRQLTSQQQQSTSRSKRRTRTQFSKQQIDCLEAVFQKSHYPEVNIVDRLSDKLGLSIERISVWFQNRRAKFKKLKKPSTRTDSEELAAALSIKNEIESLLNPQTTTTINESSKFKNLTKLPSNSQLKPMTYHPAMAYNQNSSNVYFQAPPPSENYSQYLQGWNYNLMNQRQQFSNSTNQTSDRTSTTPTSTSPSSQSTSTTNSN